MKILVTGGAGFIGSAVIRHIIQNTQDSVINLDKLTYAGNLESLAEVSNCERYAFEQVDICNREVYGDLPHPDDDIDIAGRSSGRLCWAKATTYKTG